MISGVHSRITKPKPGVRINPAHPLSKGLVGYWLFNEGTGSVAHDISGHGNHGTLKNMSPNAQGSGWGGSKFGGGLGFDGSNDYVDLGGDVVDITGALTISAWTKSNVSDPGTTGNAIVTKDNAATNGRQYSLQQHPAINGVRFGVSGDGSSYTNRDAGQSMVAGTLYHIVGVYNPSTNLDIYIDGILNNGALNNGPIPMSIQNTATPTIFGSFLVPDTYWKGVIDIVSIYNRALSAREAKQLYYDPFCNLMSPRHWYVPTTAPSGAIMNPFQKANIGAYLYNGALA